MRIRSISSSVVTERSMNPNSPESRTSRAASTKPVIAARYSDVARLIRRTPAAASSGTEKDLPFIPTMKLNGFEIAEQTVRTAAISGSPGANNTPAPGFSKACSRRMVSSRLGEGRENSALARLGERQTAPCSWPQQPPRFVPRQENRRRTGIPGARSSPQWCSPPVPR